jgi:outer membrane biosynthesis protein TonB
VKDEVVSKASAPERIAAPQLRVRARRGYANLRKGPGTDYPVAGITRIKETYPIIDMKDRWLKVSVKTDASGRPLESAWVRSDMVQVIRD